MKDAHMGVPVQKRRQSTARGWNSSLVDPSEISTIIQRSSAIPAVREEKLLSSSSNLLSPLSNVAQIETGACKEDSSATTRDTRCGHMNCEKAETKEAK
jgi:hypothetical protein